MKHSSFKEEHIVILAFVVVLLLIVVFFNKFKVSSPPPPVASGPYVDPCAIPVTTSCDVVVEREFSDCKDTVGISETLETLLAQPEESDSCREAQLRIGAPCPTGCLVDFSTLYRLAGKVEVKVLTTTENGCLVRGTRVVNMRASCSKDANHVEPTPATSVPE